MRIVAVLPMRSGSQRVKNKNLKLLFDRPLFEFALEQLSKVSRFDEIVVDSNSDEILQAVTDLGHEKVQISKRPENLAQATTSMVEVLKLVSEKYPADWYFQAHSTSPFLSSETMDSALSAVVDNDSFDSGFGVSKIQMRLWTPEGKAINHDPKILLPTQNLDPICIENSSFYIYKTEHLEELNTRYGHKPVLIEVPKVESIDIDDLEDFGLAELIRIGQIHGDVSA